MHAPPYHEEAQGGDGSSKWGERLAEREPFVDIEALEALDHPMNRKFELLMAYCGSQQARRELGEHLTGRVG